MKHFFTVTMLAPLSIRRWLARVAILLRERHPLWLHSALAALIYLGAAGPAAGGTDAAGLVLRTATAAGIGTVFCLFLVFRLSDELKDVATDHALFPDRPLPSGRALRSDVMLMMGLAIAKPAPSSPARPPWRRLSDAPRRDP